MHILQFKGFVESGWPEIESGGLSRFFRARNFFSGEALGGWRLYPVNLSFDVWLRLVGYSSSCSGWKCLLCWWLGDGFGLAVHLFSRLVICISLGNLCEDSPIYFGAWFFLAVNMWFYIRNRFELSVSELVIFSSRNALLWIRELLLRPMMSF